MDCNMPVMDGYVATRILKDKMKKNELIDIPIIAHTAYCKDNTDKKITENGFDEYLPKPFNIAMLKTTLKKFF